MASFAFLTNGQKHRVLCLNANGIYNDRLDLLEVLHNLYIDLALICETKISMWFKKRNPGYRIYNTRGPNLIHDGTVVLVKVDKHVVVQILMLYSLHTTAIMESRMASKQ